MKQVIAILVSALLMTPGVSLGQVSDLQTVSYVDLSQYAGRWYQISRNPLPFEPLDCACAQQTLLPTNDGRISVHNSCNIETPQGPFSDIRGFATVADPVSNAKFTVDLGLPKLGNYWIIDLASDYKWAVVSDPTRASLYILSKTPEMSEVDYFTVLMSVVAINNVDISKLRITSQVNCKYPPM